VGVPASDLLEITLSTVAYWRKLRLHLRSGAKESPALSLALATPSALRRTRGKG
jgi:hypothetical protein